MPSSEGAPLVKAQTERERLLPYRYGLCGVGLVHTLLCAGVVFGWSSLEAVLRAEGTFGPQPEKFFALVFTLGAVGNYVANLPFGALLDAQGPKFTGCVASACFAASVALASVGVRGNRACLAAGVFGLGFSGPAIQLPTLSLACLFDDGAAAMSLQAAAFDGGAFVFAAARFAYDADAVSSSTFLTGFLAVPVFTFLTSVLFWPRGSVENPEGDDASSLALKSPGMALRRKLSTLERSFSAGPGSPFILASPVSLFLNNNNNNGEEVVNEPPKTVRAMVTSRSFVFLASFAAVHILKLNFIVTSVNAQCLDRLGPGEAAGYVQAFGWMLPFGFVSAPFTASILSKDPVQAFMLANVLGLVYGAAMYLGVTELWLWVAFPLVALSRQLVYSSVFHFLADEFGFSKYGTLLGIVNLVVAAAGFLQYPLVALSTRLGSYSLANLLLIIITLPLFSAPLYIRKRSAPPQRYNALTVADDTPPPPQKAASFGAVEGL